MKMAVFLDVASCNLLDTGPYFIGAFCLIALMIEAVSSSENPVNIYKITRCSIPEERHLHTRRCEDLKSHQNPKYQ
jgi:hypothetical protein